MGAQWKQKWRELAADQKGKIVGKLVREIQVAAKMGGAHPEFNARLSAAIAVAKKQSVTRDTIERAIAKGSGTGPDAVQYDTVVYEGFTPHRVPVVVECLTDNRNRTAPETAALEADADDMESKELDDDETGTAARFYCQMANLDTVTKALKAAGWTITTSELTYRAKEYPELSEQQHEEVTAFLQGLDGHADVHRVHAALK